MPGGAAWTIPLAPRNASSKREEEQVCERPEQRSPSAAASQEPEDGGAAAGQDAEEVERSQQQVDPAQRRARAEHGARRRAALADREREHALLAVAVVRDDAPADGVVAVAESARSGNVSVVPARERPSLRARMRACVVDGGVPACATRTVSSKTTANAARRVLEHRAVGGGRLRGASRAPRRRRERERGDRDRGGDGPHARREATAGTRC